MAVPDLTPGITYDWDALGSLFGFKPAYLSAAGGMVVSTGTDCLLLITHPGGGKAFDYADYWDDGDLVYTGRGQSGDQKRQGANLDVAENRRPLLVFEAAGARALRYIGQAQCVGESTGRVADRDGQMRNVLLFRLRFSDTSAATLATPADVPMERRMPAPAGVAARA